MGAKLRKYNRAGITELKDWFELNPDAQISAREAARKLQINERSAITYLGHLASEGLLERVSIYRIRKETSCPTTSSESVFSSLASVLASSSTTCSTS